MLLALSLLRLLTMHLRSMPSATSADTFLPFPEAGGLAALCDLVEQRHHRYVRNNIPVIDRELDALCVQWSKEYPFLDRVLASFRSLSDGLFMHLQKEDIVVFPYIRRLEKAWHTGDAVSTPHFGSLATLLVEMNQEQVITSRLMAQIRVQTSGYFVPKGNGQHLKNVYDLLQHFEADLQEHVRIEHELIFPKAIALEKQLNGNR